MVTNGQFKLIRFAAKETNGLPYMALFDLNADPLEATDLAKDPRYAAIVNRESAAIDTFLLKFGVPPMNVKLTVSTKPSGTTLQPIRDFKVIQHANQITFVPGTYLKSLKSSIELSIYTQNGVLIKRVASDLTSEKSITWDMSNTMGKKVPSGTYLYRYSFVNEEGTKLFGCGKLVRSRR